METTHKGLVLLALLLILVFCAGVASYATAKCCPAGEAPACCRTEAPARTAKGVCCSPAPLDKIVCEEAETCSRSACCDRATCVMIKAGAQPSDCKARAACKVLKNAREKAAKVKKFIRIPARECCPEPRECCATL
jgi:hypothetical protein